MVQLQQQQLQQEGLAQQPKRSLLPLPGPNATYPQPPCLGYVPSLLHISAWASLRQNLGAFWDPCQSIKSGITEDCPQTVESPSIHLTCWLSYLSTLRVPSHSWALLTPASMCSVLQHIRGMLSLSGPARPTGLC